MTKRHAAAAAGGPAPKKHRTKRSPLAVAHHYKSKAMSEHKAGIRLRKQARTDASHANHDRSKEHSHLAEARMHMAKYNKYNSMYKSCKARAKHSKKKAHSALKKHRHGKHGHHGKHRHGKKKH